MPGLCFTKLENGRPSYGACCFKNGFFESHHLLGHYSLSQPTPKPIYKRNRIVLGGNLSDTSAESFINANEISPGLIAAQCPMTSYPKSFANTVEDMKKMLVEQNVRLWVQLSPASEEGELMEREEEGSTKSFCEVFPLKYLLPSALAETSAHQKGVSNFSFVYHKEQGLFDMAYTLTAFVRKGGVNDSAIVDTVFDPMTIIRRYRRKNQVLQR